MIISEKQIMQLIKICDTYRRDLQVDSEMKNIYLAESIFDFLNQIKNQQSDELKVFE